MPCSRGEVGADGHRCPSVENAPQTVEGVEALDVAERCASQLRIAPNGRVIGFDLPALFQVGKALGFNRRGLAELLPAVEAGMVSGFGRMIEEQESQDHGE